MERICKNEGCENVCKPKKRQCPHCYWKNTYNKNKEKIALRAKVYARTEKGKINTKNCHANFVNKNKEVISEIYKLRYLKKKIKNKPKSPF